MAFKFSLSLLFGILLNTGIHAQFRSNRDLLGIWEGNQLWVEFNDQSRVTIHYTGEPGQTGTYTTDFFKKPAHLGMQFERKGEKRSIKCIIELIDNNTIRWEAFDKGDYPEAFSNDAYILKRRK